MIAKAVAEGASGPDVDRLLADLAFESRQDEEALARYAAMLQRTPGESVLAERAGIAALRLHKAEEARAYLNVATASPNASWRAWNALGVAADEMRDWTVADTAFARASALAPAEAEILNNRGWSHIMRNNWAEAVALLEQAVARDPKSTRIANNLELARAALADKLPERRRGETNEEYAARLNDAGIAARLRGDQKRAIAAFSRAIQARTDWYERAANNLKQAEAAK